MSEASNQIGRSPVTSSATSKSMWREGFELAQTIGCALAIALVLRTAMFQPFTIPSSSMEPGLVTGDYIIVSKFAYGWSRASFPFDPPLFAGRRFGPPPSRGDVIVFRLPRDPRQTWVKRLIGLPGDRIQVRDGQVFINGRGLPQRSSGATVDHDDPGRPVMLAWEQGFATGKHLIYTGAAGHEGDNTGIYVVPAGCYFVMGDNRDNSLDSRWPREVGVGFLPAENIVGKAEIVLASWRPGSSVLKPWTWLNLQFDRLLRPVR